MARVAAVLFLLAARSAISLNLQQEPSPPEIGATGLGKDLKEMFDLEQAAVHARDSLETAKKAVQDIKFSSRDLTAMDKRAQAEEQNLLAREAKLDSVVDAMDHEGNLGAIDTLRMFEQETKEEKKGDRKLAQMGKQLMKMDKSVADEERNTEGAVEHAWKSEMRQQREEERMERQMMKDLVRARRANDKLTTKGREWQHRHRELEEATATRLWIEADALRAEVKGYLSHDQILKELDISDGDFANMRTALWDAVYKDKYNGSWLEDRLEFMRRKAAGDFAHLVEVVNHTVLRLSETHGEYTDDQFLWLISQFVTDVGAAVAQAEEDSVNIGKRILSWSTSTPDKVTDTLARAITGVTNNAELKNRLLVRSTHLASSTSEACNNMAALFKSELRPAYHDIEHIKDKLNNLSKVVPTLLSSHPLFTDCHFLGNTSTALLNIAYANHLALKESSELLISKAAPIMFQRLHCNFTGASARARLGIAAAAAAAAAWLAL